MVFGWGKDGKKQKAKKPNVVFVLIDMVREDHRAGRKIFVATSPESTFLPVAIAAPAHPA